MLKRKDQAGEQNIKLWRAGRGTGENEEGRPGKSQETREAYPQDVRGSQVIWREAHSGQHERQNGPEAGA